MSYCKDHGPHTVLNHRVYALMQAVTQGKCQTSNILQRDQHTVHVLFLFNAPGPLSTPHFPDSGEAEMMLNIQNVQ